MEVCSLRAKQSASLFHPERPVLKISGNIQRRKSQNSFVPFSIFTPSPPYPPPCEQKSTLSRKTRVFLKLGPCMNRSFHDILYSTDYILLRTLHALHTFVSQKLAVAERVGKKIIQFVQKKRKFLRQFVIYRKMLRNFVTFHFDF